MEGRDSAQKIGTGREYQKKLLRRSHREIKMQQDVTARTTRLYIPNYTLSRPWKRA